MGAAKGITMNYYIRLDGVPISATDQYRNYIMDKILDNREATNEELATLSKQWPAAEHTSREAAELAIAVLKQDIEGEYTLHKGKDPHLESQLLPDYNSMFTH